MQPSFNTLLANKPLQIVLIVAALAVGIYWYGQRSGEEKRKLNPDLPDNGSGIPHGWNPDVRATALYDVMSGVFTLTATKEAEWATCMTLTNDQLTAVYGAFNRRYCSDDDQTLTSWIKWEGGAYFGSVKDAFLHRLRSLNLN